MILKNTYIIFLFLLFNSLTAKEINPQWAIYWSGSGKRIVADKSNQKLLGGAAITALAVTQIDMKVKNYIQSNKVLSAPVSHIGDKYGGAWGHWILWSSILATSKINNDSQEELFSKLQFSSLAMVTNGIITYGMKIGFGRERPNGSCCKSFPSGHTSHSFTIAAIAHELYGNQIGSIAYGLATLVAVSRINDNKHYLSDVIFGTALGTVVGRSFAIQYNENNNNIVVIGITPQLHLRITFPL